MRQSKPELKLEIETDWVKNNSEHPKPISDSARVALVVTIDMPRAKMMVRRHAGDAKPFCYINLPTKTGDEGSQVLSKALMHPKLQGCGEHILDDITATLWAYINIWLLPKPVDMDRFKFIAGSRRTLCRDIFEIRQLPIDQVKRTKQRL